MAASGKSSERFRSATEFPKAVDHLDQAEANALYREMRDCLIFTNRSRSQLIRRNEEHKQSAIQLKADVARLQAMIGQLTLEKQSLAEADRQIISALEQEMGLMSGHLDKLSSAFDAVADIETSTQLHWGFLSVPSRFLNFIKAVRTIVVWWKEEQPEDAAIKSLPDDVTQKTSTLDETADRRANPQMYQDSASIGRSLLDK